MAANESDLVARCYYGKRRLVWEILDRGTMLKRKIEVPWQNISAMRAITKRNGLGTLEIEVDFSYSKLISWYFLLIRTSAHNRYMFTKNATETDFYARTELIG